jgi:hypothetical protein
MNTNRSIEKLVNGRQLSMKDDIVTPPQKITAELQRMQNTNNQPGGSRHEDEDCQKASLGGQILTPQRKMNMAWQEIQGKKNQGAV